MTLIILSDPAIAQSTFCNVPSPNPMLQRERTIVIIDTSVEDYPTLVEGVIPGHEVYLLEADQCGITQITQILREQVGIASLHIVSHGRSGHLQLGSSGLNLDNLLAHKAQLQVWRSALNPQADILLYGCEVAQGERGKAFVNALSQLTGADIAASENLTGNAAKGGDWALDYQTGSSKAPQAFTPQSKLAYQGVLVDPLPGGIGNSLNLWLKADAGITQSGGAVSNWADQSAFGNNASQATASAQPTLQANAINGNAALSFDGTADVLRGTASVNFSAPASIFLVAKQATPEDQVAGIFSSMEGGIGVYADDSNQYVVDGVGAYYLNSANTGTNTSQFRLVSANYTTNSTSNASIFMDGLLAENYTDGGLSIVSGPNFEIGGRTDGGYPTRLFRGNIAEVIVYNRQLSTAEQQKVESYLGLKYGISLNPANNYVNSSGTTIYDSTGVFNGYVNDIAGIGQDDGSALLQTQSRSIDTDDIVTIGNASDLQNNEFLIWGNNNDDNGVIQEITFAGPSGINRRSDRVWRVEETGNVGTTTVSFDVSGFAVSGTQASDFKLLIQNPNNDFTTTVVNAGSFSGGVVTFTGVNWNTGDYFTLGTNVNDAPTGTVTITGTSTKGQTLTAANNLADADGLGTITYKWQADGTDITGAAGNTFVLGQAQVGKTITVKASYTDGQGTAESVTSAATTAVASISGAPTGSVTITGTARQGQTLTVSNNLADADGLGTITYKWQANGTDITGATGNTFVLGQAQVGKTITAKASYTDGQGTAESVTSAATGAVMNVNDAPTGTVTITGTARQGQTLTAANNLADADGLGTITYKWQANGTDITGATGNTFVLGQAQVGKTITVKASYTDGQGTAESVTSAATSSVVRIGSTGNDVLKGGAGADVLNGGQGKDILHGGAGDDFLFGGVGNDKLLGEAGNDHLFGGPGDDTLIGGIGADTLVGDTGRDHFVFNTLNTGVDEIVDFSVHQDVIQVSARVFGGGLRANKPIGPVCLRIGSRALDANDRFIYDKKTGALFFDKDGLGGGQQVQFAQLSKGLNLSSGNFDAIA